MEFSEFSPCSFQHSWEHSCEKVPKKSSKIWNIPVKPHLRLYYLALLVPSKAHQLLILLQKTLWELTPIMTPVSPTTEDNNNRDFLCLGFSWIRFIVEENKIFLVYSIHGLFVCVQWGFCWGTSSLAQVQFSFNFLPGLGTSILTHLE